jgi:methylenetetrahydrofolate reductase (NADPH)
MTTCHFVPSDLTFSLEVFPPKSEEGVEKLEATIETYLNFGPSFITVTFGAGGTVENAERAQNVVRRIAGISPVPVAAHMICAGRTRTEVDSIVDGFYADGVRRLVALRGDILQRAGPYVPHQDGYEYTYDFIAAVKKRYTDMHISVAGYPERHPESPNTDHDLDHLKRKVDAGADCVLSQFFFDPDVFLRWRDAVAARGITVPVVPGLMPILNFERAANMAKKCGTDVPGFLVDMFDGVSPDSLDHKLLAMNVLSHQITRLIENGVKSFHFYTLNDTLLFKHLCMWLRAGF